MFSAVGKRWGFVLFLLCVFTAKEVNDNNPDNASGNRKSREKWGNMQIRHWLCKQLREKRVGGGVEKYISKKKKDISTQHGVFVLLWEIKETKCFIFDDLFMFGTSSMCVCVSARVCCTHRTVPQVSHVAGVAEQLSKHIRCGFLPALQHPHCLVTAASHTRRHERTHTYRTVNTTIRHSFSVCVAQNTIERFVCLLSGPNVTFFITGIVASAL